MIYSYKYKMVKTEIRWQGVRFLPKSELRASRFLSVVLGQERKVELHVVLSFPNSDWQAKTNRSRKQNL